MKTIYSKLFLTLTTAVSLGSCSPQYYSTNMHNTPLLKEKGDIKFNAAVSKSEFVDTPCVELQGAYAFSNHWALIGDYHRVEVKYDDDNYNKGYSGAFGIGYFTPIKNTDWIFETYGRVGTGRSMAAFEARDNNVGPNAHYTQQHSFSVLSLQSNIGYKHNFFEAAISTKVSRVGFYERMLLYDGVESNFAQDEYDPYRTSHLLLEPGIMLAVGFKNIKIQSGLSCELLNEVLPMQNLNFSLGLSVSLNSKDVTEEK
jgi:hypothetical protein